MKKLAKISLFIFVPLIVGLILQLTGTETVRYIGYFVMSLGTLVTAIGIFIVGFIMMITGRLEDKAENKKFLSDGSETTPSTGKSRDREVAEISEVNASYGYDSNNKSADYHMRHVSDIYKNSTDKEKVLGWLFFAFLMISVVLALVFSFLSIWIGAIICFSLFVGTIIISFIVKLISERTSMRAKPKKINKAKKLYGHVKNCFLSSSTSTGGSERRHTTRITGVTYRIVIETAEGEFTAYSDNFYEAGESVMIAVIGKRRASIVDMAEIREKVKKILNGNKDNDC